MVFSNSAYDALVAIVNSEANSWRFCLEGCGKNLSCRRDLISAAVLASTTTQDFNQIFDRTRIRQFVESIKKYGDPGALFVPENFLNDRNIDSPILPGKDNDPLVPRTKIGTAAITETPAN